MIQNIFDRLLDGLADDGYAIYDHFLSEQEVNILLDAFEQQRKAGLFRPAGIGSETNYQRTQSIRGDSIHWIDRSNLDEHCHFFFNRLDLFITYLNRTFFLSIKSAEMHFSVFPTDAFYRRHLDVFHQSQRRVLSIVCYLNPGWTEADGGQLRIYLPEDKTIDILPLAGRVVCFRSDQFEHEVLPANKNRRSLTGWLKNNEPLF